MKTVFKFLAAILAVCVLLFAVMNVVSLPINASLLTQNPQDITLKGVDRTRKVTAVIRWAPLKIRLKGFQIQAKATGTFIQSAEILDQLINPSEDVAVVNKRKIKVWHMTNSSLACQGVAEGLQCNGKIRMRIDTFLGKIKNTVTLTSLSRSELNDDNEITFRHRITDGRGVPSLILDALNSELESKDKTRALPKFFTEHNVDVIDHAFTGSSNDDTLGVQLILKMSIADLLAALL